MGTGQMLMTILAVFLLTTVILTTNRSLLTNTETLIRAKQDLVSISLATSLLERAARLDFDAKTVDSSLTSLAGLSTIGRESGEVAWKDSLYNDVDDYDNYMDTVLIGGTQSQLKDVYFIKSNVYYVDATVPWGPPLSGTTKSWLKRIEVRVWPQAASSVADTFYLCQLHGYWKWR